MKSIQSTASNRRILVVDDNAAIHADFKKILAPAESHHDQLEILSSQLFGTPAAPAVKRPTFEISSAFQGQEALQAVQSAVQNGTPFAMAFVDVRMPPGWDGVETTARLWEVDPNLQIVICTAYSDYSWDQMAARLGTSDRMVILKKPFDSVEVLQLANALTEKWKLLQQATAKFQDMERIIAERTAELRLTNEQLRGEIRERQTAEEVLRSTQDKLNHFLARSPAVLFSLQIENETPSPAWVSDNFTHFTGYNVGDWYRQAVTLDYVIEADRESVRASHARLLAQDQSSVQYRVRRRDGSERWVRDDRQLLRNGGERPVEIVGCWTDITEQRLLEEELRQSQKMESVGLLAGGVAHDFNNLLTVIRCHVELMLNMGKAPDTMTDPLQRILAAANRAANLTRQLLAFSRKQVMRPEELDLNELVSSVTKLLSRTLGEHIAIDSSCAVESAFVQADRGMLEQVLMNLALNARDAMPRGGTLTLATSICEFDNSTAKRSGGAPGRFVCLSVSDDGCGIAGEHLPRIFEPFFTTKEVGKGTGLGLATVYGVIKQHEGWVDVESKPNSGTTFRIFLPASNKCPATAAQAKPVANVRGGTETILVVEDETALCGLVCTTLRRQGYRVFTAASGAEALRNFGERLREIDLLLTDLVMPDGVTGQELATQFKMRKPELKTLYMSGYSADLNRQAATVGRELSSFLPKPFGLQALSEAVRACLDGKTPERPDSANHVRLPAETNHE